MIMLVFFLFCGALQVASSVSALTIDVSQNPNLFCSSLVGGIDPCELFGGAKFTCLSYIFMVLPTYCLSTMEFMHVYLLYIIKDHILVPRSKKMLRLTTLELL